MYDFSKLQGYLDSLIQSGVPGCSAAIYLHGEPVFSYCTGYADQEKTRPTAPDDIYYIYSCTKPVTVAAAMQLVEQGKLGLDDPVCRYLPEHADAYYLQDGKPVTVGETMTVRHLFTMSAGLDYDLTSEPIRTAQERYGSGITTRQMVAAFVQKPLLFKPGTQMQYSFCHDVLAVIVEIVSGKHFGEYLREQIFTPLGMSDTGFFPTKEHFARMADQYQKAGAVRREKTNDFQLSAKYESGGAGLFSTLTDYGRFAAAMSCGGQAADGTRILKTETVDLIRTPQKPGFGENNWYCMPGYEYGFGVRTRIIRSGGRCSYPGEFGWDGAAGAHVLMDPTVQVALVYMQHAHDCPHPPYARLQELCYETLEL